MQYETIAGESIATGHENWIEINSVQWGVGRGISSPTGGSADREAAAPSFSEIVITKTTDKTTPLLFKEAVAGEGKKVTIHFVSTSQSGARVYEKIELENVLVSGFSQSSGGDRPTESLSLNFTKIIVTYTPYDDKGVAGPDVRCGFDLATGKSI